MSGGFLAVVQPGGIIINQIKLSNFNYSEAADLKFVVEEFEIVEDIASPIIRGHLVVRDTLSLVTRLPIVGGEQLDISFQTPTPVEQSVENKVWEHSFIVTAVKALDSRTLREETFVLEFASPQIIPARTKKIARSYKDMPISEMVKRIAIDYLGIEEKKLDIEDTKVQRDWVVPNIPPFEAIQILASEARSPIYPASDYVFYEERDKFHFRTLDWLRSGYRQLQFLNGELAAPETVIEEEYFFVEQSVNAGHTASKDNTSFGSLASPQSDYDASFTFMGGQKSAAYRRIVDYSIPTLFDFEKAIVMGLFDNSIFEVDPWAQNFHTHKFNYYNQFEEFKHIYEKEYHKILPGISNFKNANGESHQRVIITNKYISETDKQLKPRERSEFLMHRISAIAQMEQMRMNVIVPGDSDRIPGHSVKIRVPEFGATDDVLKSRHKYLAGKWLVMSVRHKYNNGTGYYSHLNLAKDIYEEEIVDTPGKISEGEGQSPQGQSPAFGGLEV